jgi:hypothetical protein
MDLYAAGAVALIVGVVMVTFRSALGELQVRSQNRFWGFRMGMRSVSASRSVILVVGMGLILVGALLLAGIGRTRR